MPKIAFVGAGSVEFTRNLLGDILAFPALAESEIALHDINPERLDTAELLAGRVAQTLGVSPRVSASLDRREALEGADYVINSIQVGGHAATVRDHEIPARYGAPPDDRRHARHRRHHPHAAHGAGHARHRQRHGRGLPGRVAPQLHEPDGDDLPARLPGHAADRRSSASATRCRARWR